MMLLSTIFFALALSLDSLGVGISYGLQGMLISKRALLVISCCSCGVLAISMAMGQLMIPFIPTEMVNHFGAGILIVLGTYLLIKNAIQMIKKQDGTLLELSIKSLGIVVQILKEPSKADLDQSGMINSKEAFFLGMALSLDSFGAGIGAALASLKTIPTSLCVGISAFVFVSLGIMIGKRLGDRVGYRKIGLFPGLILTTLGISRLFFN